MFINPKYAIEQGWITGLTNPDKQCQANAIDFTIDTLGEFPTTQQYGVEQTQFAAVGETGKTMRPIEIVPPILLNSFPQPGWVLQPGKCYDGTSKVFVKVPEGVVALLYTRSTFVRNGVFLQSGIYDSLYSGHIGFVLFNMGGLLYVEAGTRVGQIAFVKSENAGGYAGGYNHEEGTHYTGVKL